MGRNNDYTTGNLLDYQCFLKHYKPNEIDLSKKTELENIGLKQKITFIGRLDEDNVTWVSLVMGYIYKMETQKIVNLLNDTDNESSRFATRKWYVINDQNNTEYVDGNNDDSNIKFETKVIKSSLCDYSDAYILVTGDITATGGVENTNVVSKNFAPFTKCVTHVNNEDIDITDNIDIIIHMCNLTEYSDN